MSGDPMKKDFPRDDFCAFLRSKIERSLDDGSDPKTVGVYINMLGLYESEDDPGFYADLFYGYYKEGLMTYRAASLAGLHAFLAAPTKHPFKAIEEGHIEVEIAVGLIHRNRIVHEHDDIRLFRVPLGDRNCRTKKHNHQQQHHHDADGC